MADDAVGRKIKKLKEEGKPQAQAEAIAMDMKNRGDLGDSPPSGIESWDAGDVPDSGNDVPAEGYDPTPQSTDRETTNVTAQFDDGGSQKGLVDGVDERDGSEQLGVSRRDVDISAADEPSTSGEGSADNGRPERVQEDFDVTP